MNTSTSLSNRDNQSVVVNGVTITPQVTSVLKEWFGIAEDRKKVLDIRIEECIQVQDCLCNYLIGVDISEELIKNALETIMLIREDFKYLLEIKEE